MFNRKFLILCLSLLFIGYACDDDNFGAPVDNFDYAGQAIIDNDSLVDFLGKHYYNDASRFGSSISNRSNTSYKRL